MSTLLYGARAISTGAARHGHVATADGRLALALSVPRSMGGDDGPGTNPEQLFAAGYAACFHGALRACARIEKLPLGDATVTVAVDLLKDADGGYRLAARIAAALPGLAPADAEHLLAAAHRLCPYSRATSGNIDVRLDLVPDAALA